MSKECDQKCSSCGETCSDRAEEKVDFSAKLNPHSSVKKVIGIVSGKGGVGKSLVTGRRFWTRISQDRRFRRLSELRRRPVEVRMAFSRL